MPDKIISLRGPANIIKTTASGSVGGTSITVSTTAGIIAGMSVTGENISTTATVVSIGLEQVVVDAENTGNFSDKTIFFTEWESLQIDSGSIAFSPVFATISASEARISVSAQIAGFTASGRITGTGSISTASWVSAATPAFVVKSDFTVSGVSSSDYPQFNFDLNTYIDATNAGIVFVQSYDGGVSLYGETTPSATVSFDYIIVKG